MQSFITSDNTPLHYSSAGTGPCIIFLHGWSSSAQEWLWYSNALQDHYKVICWNARGHGLLQSHAQDTDVSLERMATDLHELLQQEAPDGALLVGHSMGALTAWSYIRQYGCDALHGLCVLDQTPKLVTDDEWQLGIYGDFDQHRNDAFITHQQRDFSDAVTRLIFSRLDDISTPLPETTFIERLQRYLTSLPSDLLSRCWVSLSKADLRNVLPTISVPVLLIYGEKSQFYSAEVANWVNEQTQNSQLLQYPDADHSPHIANGERFTTDLKTFADSIISRSQPESPSTC